jgi:hypothetical protein
MTTSSDPPAAVESAGDRRLAILLAMAMFVLVVDTARGPGTVRHEWRDGSRLRTGSSILGSIAHTPNRGMFGGTVPR